MGVIITESVEELIDKDESLEKNKKQKEYLDYIAEHRFNVLKAFNMFFIPLLNQEESFHFKSQISDEEFKEAIKICAVNILDHDASKYGDDEFDGYREKYYPTSVEKAREDFEKQSQERAEKAWESHYTNNPHHPLYWKDDVNGGYKDMQLEYIIEMICDWASFSLKNGDIGELYKWYRDEAGKEKSQMTDKTRLIVEELIDKFVK